MKHNCVVKKGPPVKKGFLVCAITLVALLCLWSTGWAFRAPQQAPLPNLDKRPNTAKPAGAPPGKAAAVAELQGRVPRLKVEFDPVTGSPKSVSATDGFLTGPDGKGAAISPASLAGVAPDDPHRVTKAFLKEHRQLFGHGPEVLEQARISREYVTAHNGLKTVIWEQQVDGIAVFEAVLISHTTSKGELVNLASQFLPSPEQAATRGTPNRAALLAAPSVSAHQAIALAAQNVGTQLAAADVSDAGEAAGPEKRQKFTAPGLKGDADAKLSWVPTDSQTLLLCWDVTVMSRQRGEMFRILLDAANGEVLVRRCLTSYLTDASYRVFTNDSPTPFSPGHSTPLTNQPPTVSRTLVTLPALDTNASPAGWINDGGNETLGNNVDAHTDRNGDNQPELPRPQGSPFRVFDFPMNLSTQDPTNYSSAAIVQLFYFCNWYHDKLYQLGFTEAAGNFQSSNFGRGGIGGDAVQADAQDGSGTDNANFSTPADGSPGRMQMYIFTGPQPRRDGDFDGEIVLHEHTHGLSWRLVGGGQALGDTQSDGMGEGWSDFYGMALLSEAGDNLNGCYASGGYASYRINPTYLQNYYFGIRRYPYSTDMTKNPLTFNDIDPAQADFCSSGDPYSPVNFLSPCGVNADEVHNEGEVWCVTLWDARANLINKYGWAVGNNLILQDVTDGMKLTPPHPNFLQARDGILQADLVNHGGANLPELWAAFAKRGMGFSATSPNSSTTAGIQESFDLPDDLRISPNSGFTSGGPVGGPFNITSKLFTLTNAGNNTFAWVLVNTSAWLNVSSIGGTLTPGGPAASVTVSLNSVADTLPMGIYSGTIGFTNLASGAGQRRTLTLRVGQPDYFSELFDAGDNDLSFQTFTFTPDGSTSFYSVCRDVASSFPTAPTGGTSVSLTDDSFETVTVAGTNTVAIYNRRGNVFYIGSNGYLTMNSGDTTFSESFASHFNRPRVSATFDDLDPGTGGSISWKQTSELVAVTFANVREYNTTATVSFQIEMFFDGRIRITYLAIGITDGLAGLSAGNGVPSGFSESNLTGNPACLHDDLRVTPASGFTSLASPGGPPAPPGKDYVLSNTGVVDLAWAAVATQPWLSADPAGGILASGTSTNVTVLINANALSLGVGTHTANLTFINLVTAVAQPRSVRLIIAEPALSISDATVWEGNTDTTNLIFEVSLSPPSTQSVTVAFATADGTAQADSDYLATNGVLEFLPGQTSQTISIVVIGDTNAEPGETLSVVLSSPSGAQLARAVATGTILTDDLGPFFDDFDPDIDVFQWSAFGGTLGSTVLATNYGGYVTSPNSLWFGDAGSRYAASRSLDTTAGGVVGFWLRIASGTNDTWETADLPGKGIVLEYSINNGSSWVEFGRYDTALYNAWTHVTPDIPVAAQTAAAQFRWRQLNNSGLGSDHWALDEVRVFIGPRPLPLLISQQPTNLLVNPGTNVGFSVTASGQGTLAYQWRFNGSNIDNPTATTSNLSLTDVQLTNNGIYSVQIRDDFSITNSANVSLTVKVRPTITQQPVGSIVAAGSNANLSVTASGTLPMGFRWRKGGVTITNANFTNVPFNTSIFSMTNVQASDATNYTVVVTNLLVGTAVLSSNAYLTVVTPPANQSTPAGSNITFSASASAYDPISVSYQWQFNGVDLDGETNTSLNLLNVQSNNIGTYAVVVTVTNSPAPALPIPPATFSASLMILTAPEITVPPAGQTVNVGSTAMFSVTASGNELSYQWYFNGASLGAGATGPTLTLPNVQPASAGPYFVTVTNRAGSVTSGVVNLKLNIPLVISQQPADLTVNSGSNVTFSVTASGQGPLSYQWRFNGSNITSATNATMSLTNVQAAHSGLYSVEIRDDVHIANSTSASLTVRVRPAISQQPVGMTVAAGSTANLSVTTTGTLPMGFRWRKGVVTIPNANFVNVPSNMSVLTITNAQASDATNYTVAITNIIVGSAVLSSNAYLTVVTPPTNQTAFVGSDVTFNASASGYSPLAIFYRWQLNGADLAGETNTSLTLLNVQPANAGTYGVVVMVTNTPAPALPIAPAIFSASLTVLNPPQNIILSHPAIMPGGNFQMLLQGNPNSSYWIEISSNLTNWTTLATLDYTNGLMPFVDTNAPASTKRFYRARLAQ